MALPDGKAYRQFPLAGGALSHQGADRAFEPGAGNSADPMAFC